MPSSSLPRRAVPLEPPVPVRTAIATALLQFDARVAPRLGARGVELSAGIQALAQALRHGTSLAAEEALFALRRTLATLGDEFTDQRTELGALMLGVEYAMGTANGPGDPRAPRSP